MDIDITSSRINHVKSIVEKLRASDKLPFAEVLSAKTIEKKINDLDYRDRTFPPDMTIFGFLSQVMGADQSCQAGLAQVIAHLVRIGKKEPSSNTSAYCKARKRLPEELLSSLAKESAQELEKQANSEWRWRNRPVKMPDGTTVSMPDTPENQAAYPQSDTQKKGLVSP
jgi:hypothetical protein